MTQLTVNIPDNKLSFFILLAKELDIAVIDKKPSGKLTAKQKKWVEGLNTALNEVELHTQGKITLKSLDQALNEL